MILYIAPNGPENMPPRPDFAPNRPEKFSPRPAPKDPAPIRSLFAGLISLDASKS